MREILVCGEALIDLVRDRDDSSYYPRLGGGPFNVAIALGRLGVATSFFSRLSTDAFGDQLVAALTAAGVNTELLQRDSRPTSLALATLDADGSAAYSFYLHGTADRFVQTPGVLPPTIAAISVGTLSLALDSVYADLLTQAREQGRIVMADPNIRPDAIVDADDYRRRFASWLGHIDILKVSDEDAEWITQGTDIDAAIDHWLSAGVSAVVHTRGGEGMRIVTAQGVGEAPPAQVSVVDTIGAGDTVHGALLAYLSTHRLLGRDALRQMSPDQWGAAAVFAARAAGVTVSRPGADPPWARELESR